MSNHDEDLDHLLGLTESAEFGLNDQIEYEDLSGDEVIVSPFDPTQIRIETKVMTIDLLRARMEANELDMAPDFQRQGGIWKDDILDYKPRGEVYL